MKRKARSKVKQPELDLSSICNELSDIETKLFGLSELLLRSATFEHGDLRLDPILNGVGEILKSQTTKLGNLARLVDQHSVLKA